MSEEVGLPPEVGVAPGTETSDGEVAGDAHAPHLVDPDPAGERLDAIDVVTPPLERLPSHG
jgi:hypothetical protein